MKIPLLDLIAQHRSLQPELEQAISDVIHRGAFILGPNVESLEEELARYLGVRHAVGVGSGTDALHLTLHAFDIGPGDEVIVPDYTFFATAEVVSHTGATPIFVDVDAETLCLDVNRVEEQITPRTKAVIPVHLFGHPANMTSLMELAAVKKLKVIEDNAQAMGAELGDRKTGALAHAGCLSFFPSKNLGGVGDGGMVVTDDFDLAAKVRKLRTHGWTTKYQPEMIGFNSRLDEIQAAVLRVKLKRLDEWNAGRRRVVDMYREALDDADVQLPREVGDVKHVYHLFVIRSKTRDRLQEQLKSRGIACGIYYPEPLHLLRPYKTLAQSAARFAVAEEASKETLAIPLYPEMTREQVTTVATAICDLRNETTITVE